MGKEMTPTSYVCGSVILEALHARGLFALVVPSDGGGWLLKVLGPPYLTEVGRRIVGTHHKAVVEQLLMMAEDPTINDG